MATTDYGEFCYNDGGRAATSKELERLTPRYDDVYFDAIEKMDKEDTLDLPVRIAQDNEAFRTLYDDSQEILAITRRAIRDGKPGYKRALHQIMEICQRME